MRGACLSSGSPAESYSLMDAPREFVHSLRSMLRNQEQFAGLHAEPTVAGHDVRLDDQRHPGCEDKVRLGQRPAEGRNDRWQVAATKAVHQVIDTPPMRSRRGMVAVPAIPLDARPAGVAAAARRESGHWPGRRLLGASATAMTISAGDIDTGSWAELFRFRKNGIVSVSESGKPSGKISMAVAAPTST